MTVSRVVSLLPSTTEIVAALGCGDRLVGRSHECDHPPGVEALPVVTEPRVPVTGDSAAVDDQLRSILAQALSVYEVHTEVLRALAPDLVLTQSLCEVCAVSFADVEAAVRDHLDDATEVVACEPSTFGDVLDDVRRVARALGVPDRGEDLAGGLRAGVDAVATRTASLPRRRVVAIEWVDPLMAAGNWVPELLDAAGGEALLGEAGKHSSWTDLDAIVDLDPEVIVIMPCGFGLERTRRESERLLEHDAFARLRAVREGRVAVTDGHRFFNRPGPRLVESTQILAEILHPGVIEHGHRDRGWQQL